MKKYVSLFLCLVLLLSAAPTVYATGTPSIICEDVSCAPGEQITVNVTVSNNPGFTYLEMTPGYAEELTLVDVTNGELISDFTEGKQYIWVADEDVKTDGLLMTFTFSVADTVPAGEYAVGFVVRTCGNYNEEPVAFAVESGTVTVAAASNTPDIGDFEYALSGTEITITGYTGTKNNVTIAETYEIDGVTYTVTAIGESAFEAGTITAVDIPATVTSIGDYAFYDCTALMRATVRNAEAQIGELAFGYYYISRKEDGLVEGFVLEGYQGSTAQTYAETESVTFSALVEDSDIVYADGDLQEILNTVEAGKTVALTKNEDLFSVVIRKDVTLDLNGYTLTADYFTGFGAVTDGENGGNALVKAEHGIHITGEGSFLPIYDTADGGYRFYRYELQNMGYKTVDGSTNNLKVGFRLALNNTAGYSVLSNTENARLELTAYVSWTGAMGRVLYTFREETLRNYSALVAADIAAKGSSSKAITLTISGVDSLGQGAVLSVQPAMDSDPGVTALGENTTWTVQ